MFHAKDGWCFERQPDKSVRIVKYKDATCQEAEIEVTLDKNSWCSIIASMSSRGETSEQWREANIFHGIMVYLQLKTSFRDSVLGKNYLEDMKISDVIADIIYMLELNQSGNYELGFDGVRLDPIKTLKECNLKSMDSVYFFDLGNKV